MHIMIPVINGRSIILYNDATESGFRFIGCWDKWNNTVNFSVTKRELKYLADIGKINGEINGRSWIVIAPKWQGRSWILTYRNGRFPLLGQWNYATGVFIPENDIELIPIELDTLATKLRDR